MLSLNPDLLEIFWHMRINFSLFWGIVGSVLTDLSSDNFEVKAVSHINVKRRKQTQTICGQVFAMINKLFETSRKRFAMTFPYHLFAVVTSQTVVCDRRILSGTNGKMYSH